MPAGFQAKRWEFSPLITHLFVSQRGAHVTAIHPSAEFRALTVPRGAHRPRGRRIASFIPFDPPDPIPRKPLIKTRPVSPFCVRNARWKPEFAVAYVRTHSRRPVCIYGGRLNPLPPASSNGRPIPITPNALMIGRATKTCLRRSHRKTGLHARGRYPPAKPLNRAAKSHVRSEGGVGTKYKKKF